MVAGKKQMALTEDSIINKCQYYSSGHYNMGFVQDETGNYIGRHKGYGYGFNCVEFPRLMFIDRVYTLDDAGRERWWYVDGVRVPDVQAVLLALSRPPVLTLSEYVAWVRLGPDPVGSAKARNIICGCVAADNEQYIHYDTPHGRASNLIDSLRAKGYITFDDDHRLVRKDKP